MIAELADSAFAFAYGQRDLAELHRAARRHAVWVDAAAKEIEPVGDQAQEGLLTTVVRLVAGHAQLCQLFPGDSNPADTAARSGPKIAKSSR